MIKFLSYLFSQVIQGVLSILGMLYIFTQFGLPTMLGVVIAGVVFSILAKVEVIDG